MAGGGECKEGRINITAYLPLAKKMGDIAHQKATFESADHDDEHKSEKLAYLLPFARVEAGSAEDMRKLNERSLLLQGEEWNMRNSRVRDLRDTGFAV